MDSSSISANKTSSNDKSRYEVFNEYNKRWLEFIPLRLENEKGMSIVDLKYDNLPNVIWGEILLGYVNQNIYIYKTYDKKDLRIKF